MDVNFSNNLFISSAELNRFKQSLGEKGWKVFAKHLVKQFGIANSGNNTYFLPAAKTGETEVITIRPGVAFDSDMNIISLEQATDISLPIAQLTNGSKYWIILSHKTTHFEEGTVNVTAQGALTGSGTDFLSVLRGQPDFPTKIRLQSQVNTGDYEVVYVSSATSAVLAGSFTQEQNLKYSVIGTFTPGFIPSDSNAQIYSYDSCDIRVVIATDISALDLEEGKDFLICSVGYEQTSMQLQDYRIYYALDNPYYETIDSSKELSEDKLVSMPKCSIVSKNSKGVLVELLLEHGFKVTNFETNVLSTGYRIDIQGTSNVFPSEDSLTNQDHLFKGWYLLNRQTMNYSIVDDSTSNQLFIKQLNPDSVTGTDTILIPPFDEIEYQVAVSGNVPSISVPYTFKFSVDNLQNKCLIPILWEDEVDNGVDVVTISLRYRMFDGGKIKYQFKKFVTSTFENYNGLSGALSDSSFTLPISDLKPSDSIRNYS